MQKQTLDTSLLSLMGGWPLHMHIDGDRDKPIRCLATDCPHTFKTNNEIRTQVNHYKYSFKEPERLPIQHGILFRMHTLNRCLVCGINFVYSDARILFHHIITEHGDEEDMSKIQGFLVHVRKFPDRFLSNSVIAREFRRETFKVAFEHLKLQLTTGPFWADFKTLMGYRDRVFPEDKLREVLTVPGEIEFFPISPAAFLLHLQYDRNRSFFTEKQWYDLLKALQELYRKGAI